MELQKNVRREVNLLLGDDREEDASLAFDGDEGFLVIKRDCGTLSIDIQVIRQLLDMERLWPQPPFALSLTPVFTEFERGKFVVASANFMCSSEIGDDVRVALRIESRDWIYLWVAFESTDLFAIKLADITALLGVVGVWSPAIARGIRVREPSPEGLRLLREGTSLNVSVIQDGVDDIRGQLLDRPLLMSNLAYLNFLHNDAHFPKDSGIDLAKHWETLSKIPNIDIYVLAAMEYALSFAQGGRAEPSGTAGDISKNIAGVIFQSFCEADDDGSAFQAAWDAWSAKYGEIQCGDETEKLVLTAMEYAIQFVRSYP